MENVIKKLRLEFCLIFIWAAVLIGLSGTFGLPDGL